MKPRSAIDAQLATLRIASTVLSPGLAQDLKLARHQLYTAFEQQDPHAARVWLRTLRAGLAAFPEDRQVTHELRVICAQALDEIEEALQ